MRKEKVLLEHEVLVASEVIGAKMRKMNIMKKRMQRMYRWKGVMSKHDVARLNSIILQIRNECGKCETIIEEQKKYIRKLRASVLEVENKINDYVKAQYKLKFMHDEVGRDDSRPY